MKKRLLAGIMMMVLVLASAMSVSAANSRTEPVYESGASVGKYTTNSKADAFSDLKQEVQNIIKELNAKKVTSLSADIQKKLAGKTLLSNFCDLEPVGKHDECASRKYHEVELTVTTLTEKCSEVVVLHYSEDRDVWEVLTPEKVDGNKITVKYTDLSPVGVYAKVADNKVGTAAPMGSTSSTWMIWTAMALIVLGSGAIVSQKKRG